MPSDSLPTPPSTLTAAWIGPSANTPVVAQTQLDVTCFEDSDDFLLSLAPYDFALYVIDLAQQGVGSQDLIRLLRRRTRAGIVALCDDASDAEMAGALELGADMALPCTASPTLLRAAVHAVQRRVSQTQSAAVQPWTLQTERATLTTPWGGAIPLANTDLTILTCLAEAPDHKVAREVLAQRLWGSDHADMNNALQAALYRLRKRIEQAGCPNAPIHAVSRVGYEFRGSLLIRSGR